jgi:hypothetical protein
MTVTPPSGHHQQPVTLALIDRRVRDTAGQAKETIDRVGALRVELFAHLERQDGAIASVNEKIDLLLDVVAVERRERSAIHIAATAARIEVQKTGELAVIEEKTARSKYNRELLIKVLAIVGPIIASLITALALGACP